MSFDITPYNNRRSGGGTATMTTVTGTDLSTLIYAFNDADAQAKGIPLKGYYLAAQYNTMGVKWGTILRREY